MSPKRIRQRLADFEKALMRLQEALAENPVKTNTIVDGTIQRFEIAFELAWKLAQNLLSYNGVEVNSPRSAIKESFKQNLIEDGTAWIEMLDDRNKTTHIYDEQGAMKIYKKIKEVYYSLLDMFRIKMSDAIAQIKEKD